MRVGSRRTIDGKSPASRLHTVCGIRNPARGALMCYVTLLTINVLEFQNSPSAYAPNNPMRIQLSGRLTAGGHNHQKAIAQKNKLYVHVFCLSLPGHLRAVPPMPNSYIHRQPKSPLQAKQKKTRNTLQVSTRQTRLASRLPPNSGIKGSLFPMKRTAPPDRPEDSDNLTDSTEISILGDYTCEYVKYHCDLRGAPTWISA